MKRKWAERKEQEKQAKLGAEKLAKETAKADYRRRKIEGELTEEESRKERKNKRLRQSRARWDDFCNELFQNLFLLDIGASIRKEAPPRKPTLQKVLWIAEHDYGFTITGKKLARLKRILGSV
jgi:hypothetical protein